MTLVVFCSSSCPLCSPYGFANKAIGSKATPSKSCWCWALKHTAGVVVAELGADTVKSPTGVIATAAGKHQLIQVL